MIADAATDLRCAVALEDFEQDSCAQAKGQAHYQAGTENIQEAGKDGEDSGALQLNIIAQSLATHRHTNVDTTTQEKAVHPFGNGTKGLVT